MPSVADPELAAARAIAAYAAMERRFRRPDGLYRRDGAVAGRVLPAHLWPYIRAFVAALDLAGLPPARRPGIDLDAVIDGHLAALERYRDPTATGVYASDVPSRLPEGDVYHDDNAWVGLALVQLARLRPDRAGAALERAAALFRFAQEGWDSRPEVVSPGGVFWLEQGRGAGLRNHDRNTVSTAPNAALGLHLAELGHDAGRPGAVTPEHMLAWVETALDASAGSDRPGTGLFFDKLRADGTRDETVWSYNQGSMVAAGVLRHRREPAGGHLARAEVIAGRALDHFEGRLASEPPAFVAIFLRGLLLLASTTGDAPLRARIEATARDYVEWAWTTRRSEADLFELADGGVALLGQSAIVSLLALLAWPPEDRVRLA